MSQPAKNILVVIIFSIAMAALESAVVVYLRAIYYQDGFTVAFKLIEKKILLVEIMREAATIVMIWGVGYLAGKKPLERFAYFSLCFAIWDIFYYFWLKVFIDWPSSLFEWDILFLIPITWLGPVLSPVICSFTMIALAMVLLNLKEEIRISVSVKSMIIVGSALILYTYLYDYGALLTRNGLLSDYFNLMQNEKFISMASSYIPVSYNWTVFCVGESLIIAGIAGIHFRSRLLNSTMSIQ